MRRYLSLFRQQLVPFVVVVVVGVIFGAVYASLRPVQYTASTSLFVSAQIGDTPQQAYQGAQLSEQRVRSYTELVRSDRVLDEASRMLGPTSTAVEEGGLVDKVGASNALNSVIIDVTATSSSAAGAADLANAVAQATARVVDELERPATPDGVAPVAVRVVQPANVPFRPSSSSFGFVVLMVGLASVVLGGIVALLRDTFDRSIRSVEHLLSAFDLPLIGAIPLESENGNVLPVVYSNPSSVQAESYREARTNLQFVSVDRETKVLVVSSAVPGEGKSTVTANLGLALSSTGRKVLLVEADLRKPRLASIFGIDGTVGLTNVLSGQVPRLSATQNWQGGVLDLLARGPRPPNPSELLGSNQMKRLLSEARAQYDYVLLDTPPLLAVTDAAALAAIADGVLLACKIRSTTESEFRAAFSALERVGLRPLGSVATMVPSGNSGSYGQYAQYVDRRDRLEAATWGSGASAVGTRRKAPEGNAASADFGRDERRPSPRPSIPPRSTE